MNEGPRTALRSWLAYFGFFGLTGGIYLATILLAVKG